MNKIIAAFDGLKFSDSTLQYAINMTKATKSHLVGIFLDNMLYTGFALHDTASRHEPTDQKLKKMETTDALKRKKAAVKFEKACQENKLEYSIHHNRKAAIRELQHESIFADMLIIDAEETFTHFTEKPPSMFMRDLLSNIHCQVLVVPSKCKAIKSVVLLYNGEPSSINAIRMFSYLVPQFANLKIHVISVNAANDSLHMHENRLFKEFMKRHFPSAKFTVLKGKAENEIIQSLSKEPPTTLVVTGSLRRGVISLFLRESMADKLMKEVKLPIFIAYYG